MILIVFYSNLLIAQGGNENNNVNQNSVPASVNTTTFTNGNSNTIEGFTNFADSVVILNEDLQEVNDLKDKSSGKSKNKTKQRTKAPAEFKKESEEDANVELKSFQEFKTIQNSIRTQDSQRSPTLEQQLKVDQLVREMKSTDSTSFNYHLTKFIAGNYNTENSYHINQAFSQNPNDKDVLKQITALSVIEADSAKTLNLLELQVQNNHLDQNFIDYGSDLLMSVPNNSTLITHSFDDTYGSLYNQLKFNQRKDVKVINLDFCQSETYRNNMNKLGYQVPKQEMVDTQYLSDFIYLNRIRALALSLTLPKSYFMPLQSDLIINGLVLLFSPNLTTGENVDLWEKLLSKKIIIGKTDLAKKLSLNYLPMLIELRNQYVVNNQMEKVREVDRIMDEIGKRTGKSIQVKELQKNN